jgi:hypothetical protein
MRGVVLGSLLQHGGGCGHSRCRFRELAGRNEHDTTRTVNMTLLPSPVPRTFYWTFRTDFQFGMATCDSSGVNCSVQVTFSPGTPGLHQDAITVKDDWNNILAQVYLSGVGEAPQVSFVPGVLSTPLRSLGGDGLFIDPAGNVYVANSYLGTVRKIAASDGSISTVAGIESNSWASPVDGVLATLSTLSFPSGLALRCSR